jgi:type II secretory ATPase GspE/PulE/Tfp pilus assembly ATPase PilB-like protein
MGAESTTIAGRVLGALVAAGVLTAEQLASARTSSGEDDARAGRGAVSDGLVTSAEIGAVLEESLGVPRVDLGSYAPDTDALALLPGDSAREHRVLPLFEIEGTLTVAISDPVDVFSLDELSGVLGVELEPVLADASAVDSAIELYYREAEAAEKKTKAGEPGEKESGAFVVVPASTEAAEATTGPGTGYFAGVVAHGEPDILAGDLFDLTEEAPAVFDAPESVDAESETEPPGALPPGAAGQTVEDVVASEPTEASAIDLDVLAVADERKVTVLVADILDLAVARGASRIHLLPYKSDFFLVFRIKGRLEKIGSAPLSLQGSLIDGFKKYAKLGRVPAELPALGRLHAEIGGTPLVLTVSAVPTVAGQRLVVSLGPARPQPRKLVDLGMTEAESRALQAMVERGRGILLISAPVAGGRSSTYYALLQHAATTGRTVYSVERSIEFEIPAVAQVLVNPGSSVGAASYFAAGIRQDTDVMAIDAMHTVEDVHLAIEAAGLGKLVIATFAGSDIVSGVRRMLDLGAEPVSLASALTLGVGQRVVRTNCPSCSADEINPLVDKIPGATAEMTTRKGSGCPNCGSSGFSGATGIFEVLPFTEPVRTRIARAASASELEEAARAAGMRSMVSSGLAKVRDGLVSVEELDRVLRFSE